MKITKTQLKQIIKEELGTLDEFGPQEPGDLAGVDVTAKLSRVEMELMLNALREYQYENAEDPDGQIMMGLIRKLTKGQNLPKKE